MKIYSMTATFGKLEHRTLVLTPGLNVITAPNEWGKSTWCAFLTAMLYGLDTRTHSTKTVLSDKERYAPWSGAPMAGRMDLNWNGRDITIERKAKGRTHFGDFRAYETNSGLPVPELTAQNCGQMLLGVEKTVFTRSAMIRLTDLPVTQDEALRRRLNALVTTGDESDTADDLERKLRDLKNRCRYNRSGLLPQAEAEAAEVERKLRELEDLEALSRKLRQDSADLQAQIRKLENHRTALAYQAARENHLRLEKAQRQFHLAEQTLQEHRAKCVGLSSREEATASLSQLQELQNRMALLRMESSQNDSHDEDSIFRGMSEAEIQNKTETDIAKYKKLTNRTPLVLILGILIFLAGIFAICFAVDYSIYGFAAVAAGALLCIIWTILRLVRKKQAKLLAEHYGCDDPAKWAILSRDTIRRREQLIADASQKQAAADAVHKQLLRLCADQPLPETVSHWQQIVARWDAMEAAEREFLHRKDHRDILLTLITEAPAPHFADELNLTETQSVQMLNDTANRLRETQRRLGQCQGQMAAIGYRTDLESRRNSIAKRLEQLEDTYAALTLALETLENARSSLQRRFAPKITGRAQELLSRLTEGRYDRLVLGSDLTLHATARDEDTLRTSLWRSDGTSDLLYLALRLAVSGELIPESPLILDDALARFDDDRLSRAMTVLKDEADQRQIILFTCHSRESQYV